MTHPIDKQTPDNRAFPVQHGHTGLVPVSPPSYHAPNNDPDDDEIDLREIWAVIMRRKGTILLIALLVFIGTMIGTLMMTPIYRANVTLQIDTDTAKVLSYDVETDTRPANDKDFYQTQYELLKSRTLARKTIDSLSLESQLKGENGEEEVAKPFYADTLDEIKKLVLGEKTPEQAKQQQLGEYPLEAKFLQNLTITPVKNSRIVTVSYDSENPQLAANVVNSLAENFIDMNLNRRKDAASYAENFLQDELGNAKSKLEESEAKLIAFAKKESIIRMDDEKQGSLTSQKMSELSAALTEAEKDRIGAESKFNQAKAASGAAKVLDNSTVQALKKNLAELQGDYQEKLQIYKPGYPLMVQIQNQINELQSQISQETGRITGTIAAELEATYLAAKQKEDQLRSELTRQKDELLDLRDKSIGYNTLQREVETNRNMYEGLLQRIKEVGVAGGIGTNNISVVDPALVPYQKHKPNTRLNLMLGLVLGIFLGTVIAFLLEFLDDRIKSASDLERLLGLPILGITPALKGKDVIEQSMATARQPTSALAEAFRSLRTNLLFATREGIPRSLAITSSMPSEAKSSTCINLATALAQAGKRVLLLDADLRKPTIHQRFKLDNSQGLSNYLTHQAEIYDVVQDTVIPGVSVITAGPQSPNPAELLSSERLNELFKLAPTEFDIIILDTPPTMGLADSLILSNRTSATVMVAAYGQSRKRALTDSMKRLRQAHANVIGVVFTKVKGGAGHGYDYDYNYYYSYGSNKLTDQTV